jgi:hypothetical protein
MAPIWPFNMLCTCHNHDNQVAHPLPHLKTFYHSFLLVASLSNLTLSHFITLVCCALPTHTLKTYPFWIIAHNHHLFQVFLHPFPPQHPRLLKLFFISQIQAL